MIFSQFLFHLIKWLDVLCKVGSAKSMVRPSIQAITQRVFGCGRKWPPVTAGQSLGPIKTLQVGTCAHSHAHCLQFNFLAGFLFFHITITMKVPEREKEKM